VSSRTLAEGKNSVMSKKTAFTLVELLVVIAIIALLMSILMPALGRVRRQAKTVICQSNLKQWGICFAMYVDDWDGYFMAGYVLTQPPRAYLDYWMEALRSCYGDVGDIRLCPMATKPGTEINGNEFGVGGGPFSAWGIFSSTWGYAVEGDYGSYGWNGYLANPPAGEGIWGRYAAKNLDPNWRNATVKGAAIIPVLLDHQWVDCWPEPTDDPPGFNGQPWPDDYGTSQMGRFTVDRHNGYLNYVFLDWSVRKVGLKESWKLKWHRLYSLNEPLPTEWDSTDHWMYKFKDPE